MLDNEEVTLAEMIREQRMTNFILRAAYRQQLGAMRDEILNDNAMAEIVRQLVDGPKAAGELRSAVAEAANVSERTVTRRIAELELMGVLEQSGRGARVRYMLTGLISI